MNDRPIIVLGADGYIGWPLSLRLARKAGGRRIILIDNLLRRRLVKSVGGRSILPIESMSERLKAAKNELGLDNIEFHMMDVNSEALPALVKNVNPIAVYHLAQQCSASFSMKDPESSLMTLRNNEEGNLRLLWAVKMYAADCHIVKLGSFGEYAKGGIDIPEGYFSPSYKGKKASVDVPYPRQADDIYHVSKINDTNYISTACRIWGLRITDVMQSTVFGVCTEEVNAETRLYTRFDSDEYFGTVANRFAAQAVTGFPLTVYGSGHQRTGLMALRDSVSSLAAIWKSPPAPGTHRVINHVTEKSYSVNELADSIREIANQYGLSVSVERGVYNPRGENLPKKMAYDIESEYVDNYVDKTPISEVVKEILTCLSRFRDRIDTNLFMPQDNWLETKTKTWSRYKNVVIPMVRTGRKQDESGPEDGWEEYRRNHFPYQSINLNPGTLGSPASDVVSAVNNYYLSDLPSQPIEYYKEGREKYSAVRQRIQSIWPTKDHMPEIAGSATQTSNLLALALARHASWMGRPLRLLATANEHSGGIGAFQKLPEFRICYLSEEEMYDREAFKTLLSGFKPDAALLSHVAYDTGLELPVTTWLKDLKIHNPSLWTIVDVSQSLGLLPLPFFYADVLFGSCHKWLFGPRGSGILWTNSLFRMWARAINWSGEPLFQEVGSAGFCPAGGLDFALYDGIESCLNLYESAGVETIRRRSRKLARYFSDNLTNILDAHNVKHELIKANDGSVGETGMFTVSFPDADPYPLYSALNDRKVFCKCIKGEDSLDSKRSYLRFGFPYYETKARLDEALGIIDSALNDQGLTRKLKNSPINYIGKVAKVIFDRSGVA